MGRELVTWGTLILVEMPLLLCLILFGVSEVRGGVLTSNQLLEAAVYARNYRAWNTKYASVGPGSRYSTCGYTTGASVCACVDSSGATVQCGESGTTGPTIENGGILANYNPAPSADTRCPSLSDDDIDWAVGTATTECSTGPSYTLDWWKETDDGVSQCFAPSKLDESFTQGLEPSLPSSTTTFSPYVPTSSQFPYFTKDGGFKAIVSAGTININLDKESGSSTTYGACSAWLYAPLNSGDLKAQGNAATEVVVFQANNVAPAGKSLAFESGNVVLLEAVSTGAGPIAFTTSNKVNVSGVTCGSACSVTWANSQDIFIADTVAEGTISLTGVTASIYNTSITSTSGAVNVNGGTYFWVGGSNAGTFTVTGNPTATVTLDANTGTFAADSGTFTMKVGLNTGSITASAGVTGTLTVLENTGTITVPAGVTLVTYTYASTKLVQTITATGVSVSDLADTAVRKSLECAIQEAIGVSECMNVAVTGVAAARRADATITYSVTYQESELATISANMASVNSNPSGTIGAAILSSLQSITGVSSITITATATNTQARNDNGVNGVLRASDSNPLSIIACLLGTLVYMMTQ